MTYALYHLTDPKFIQFFTSVVFLLVIWNVLDQ